MIKYLIPALLCCCVLRGQDKAVIKHDSFQAQHRGKSDKKKRQAQTYPFKLAKLPYKGWGSLFPVVGPNNLYCHRDFHKMYILRLNHAIKVYKTCHDWSASELLVHVKKLDQSIRKDVCINASEHLNHDLCWKCMRSQEVGNEPSKDVSLAKQIVKDFDSFASFKNAFVQEAHQLREPGWIWLVIKQDKNGLGIMHTKAHGNPITKKCMPLLGLDLWEHAYCSDYGPHRHKYIKKWWKTVNWHYVNKLYEALQEKDATPSSWSDVFDLVVG